MKRALQEFDPIYFTPPNNRDDRRRILWGGSPDPPQPDPAVGAAASSNAQLGREQLDFNKQVYQEGKPRQERMDALAELIANQSVQSSQQNQQIADDYYRRLQDTFYPIEDSLAKDARYGSDYRQIDLPQYREWQDTVNKKVTNPAYDSLKSQLDAIPAKSKLMESDLVDSSGDTWRPNAALYASNPAYKAKWDQLFSEHQAQFNGPPMVSKGSGTGGSWSWQLAQAAGGLDKLNKDAIANDAKRETLNKQLLQTPAQVASEDQITRNNQAEIDSINAENSRRGSVREEMDRAAGDVAGLTARNTDAQLAQQRRQLSSYGLRPIDPGYQAAESEARAGAAAVSANAENQARNNVKNLDWARRIDVAGLGRNLPSNQATSTNIATNQGNSALSAGAAPINTSLASAGLVNGGYGANIAANNSAGQLALGNFNMANTAYGNDYTATQNRNGAIGALAGAAYGAQVGSAIPGVGTLAGAGLGAALGGTGARMFKDGGPVTPYNDGLRPRYYDEGGPVAGQFDGEYDKVPAMLTEEEGVLNREAMKIVGKEFLDNINQIGLKMRGEQPDNENGEHPDDESMEGEMPGLSRRKNVNFTPHGAYRNGGLVKRKC